MEFHEKQLLQLMGVHPAGEMLARRYVVTGSASGMGLATSELLKSRGYQVIGVDIHRADVVVDLSHQDGRARMLNEVALLADGGIDGLIACAGVGGGQGAPELVVAVNYFGAVATLEGLRPLLANGHAPGAVVIASIAALRPERDDPVEHACLSNDEELALSLVRKDADGRRAYAASKRALVRAIRRIAPSPAWAGAGIALNCIGPAIITTPMSRYLRDTEEQRRQIEAQIPMPLNGFGRPENVASLLAWLTSADNTIVTGQMIFVDGGYEALTRGDEAW